MRKLIVSSSPHVTASKSTRTIMLDVIIALCCPLVASIVLYGFYPLFLALLSVGAAVLTEYLFCLVRKKPNSIGDLSAVVTGLILALCLPPVVPFYVPITGAVFAIAIVKMLFGGIGKNFANPAATGRIFLMLAWTGIMTSYVAPINWANGFATAFEFFKYGVSIDITAITGATPLAAISAGNPQALNNLDLFLGRIAGSAGEVSALAVILGGVYLIVRRVIDWKIPLVFLVTVVLFSLAFYQDASYILPSLLSGGVMFGAFFMATDYATSPNTAIGACIFAFGCGFLTMIIRRFGNLPEGVSLAILLMNIVTPLIDKYVKPHPFGYVKPERKKKVKEAKV